MIWEQFAFVKRRQLLDGLFLINEVVSWSKATRNPHLFFKVDFEKDCDSLSWDYILEIM